MKNVLTIIAIGFFISCGTSKQSLNFNKMLAYDQIDNFVDYEKRKGSKDITPTHNITLGVSLYPNDRNYELGIPIIYSRNEGYFKKETSYYYSIPDSSVKAILYIWDKKIPSSFEIKKEKEKNIILFRKKWNDLAQTLTEDLGRPTYINIESTNYGDTVIDNHGSLEDLLSGENPNEENVRWRDDIKWVNDGGINLYMFMIGNNRTGFRQIRLVVYHE